MIGAIDIGGTKTEVGLVDESGRMVATRRLSTPMLGSFTAAMGAITGVLTGLAEGRPLAGVGVACTGPVDPADGVLGDVDLLPGWEGGAIVSVLSGALGVRVVVENDADAAALGEATWGSGRDAPSLLYVTVSTGIGAGYVRDGRLVRDSHGEHAEYGHHVIEADGPLCYCGSRGCWEALASGTAIARRFDDLSGGNPGGLSVAGILADDDPMCVQVRREAARYLGIGLANLVTILRPDVVALGGGVVGSWDVLRDDVMESVARHSRYVSIDDIVITPAHLRPYTALIGAAAAYLRRDEEPWT